MAEPEFTIARYDAHLGACPFDVSLDRIFYASSPTQSFANEDDRQRFRERWLGRYLINFSDCAFVATAAEEVVGYVVGASTDPAKDPLFGDIGYLKAFSDLTASFPAHLHVNVDARHRGCGVGAALVNAFAERMREQHVPGIHVVTAKGARNVAFYLRNGFSQIGATTIDARELVFLAQRLFTK